MANAYAATAEALEQDLRELLEDRGIILEVEGVDLERWLAQRLALKNWAKRAEVAEGTK